MVKLPHSCNIRSEQIFEIKHKISLTLTECHMIELWIRFEIDIRHNRDRGFTVYILAVFCKTSNEHLLTGHTFLPFVSI